MAEKSETVTDRLSQSRDQPLDNDTSKVLQGEQKLEFLESANQPSMRFVTGD